MKPSGSYNIQNIAANPEAEVHRLNAQVDLFWDAELRQYKRFGLRDGMQILEVGSGTGYVTGKLLEAFPNCEVCAVELDPYLIDVARKYLTSANHERFRIVQQSVMSLTLAENGFDFAITRMVLEHVPDPATAVFEIRRCLKPNATAVFTDNDFANHLVTSPPVPHLNAFYEAYCNARLAEGGNPYIGRELPEILRRCGFDDAALEVICSHSAVVGDDVFFRSEGVGIAQNLVRSGDLDAKDLAQIAVEWRQVIKEPNHSIMRQIYMAAGTKGETVANVGVAQAGSTSEPRSDTTHNAGSDAQITQKQQPQRDDLTVAGVRARIRKIFADIMAVVNDASGINDATATITSIQAVELAEAIYDNFAVDIGVDIIFDCHSAEDLAAHVSERLMPGVSASDEGSDGPAPSPRTIIAPASESHRSGDIAIIGMSGRFPGAHSVDAFWANLEAGVSSIREIDRKGWDLSELYDPELSEKNKSVSKWGGLLENFDTFDPAFFNISDIEAEMMDPQQRVFLEEAYTALESAGYAPDALAGRKVGVFVGARYADYLTASQDACGANPHLFVGNDLAILSGRISYYLDLKGPSLTVDTACSASLVAILLAADSIRRGECTMALAGGVYVMSSPEFYMLASNTNMLSPDGKCKTFDSGANGIVPGEAAGTLVLKGLQDAVCDGDHILGIIRGAAMNQDGRTQGITAPSSDSQQDVICQAYENAGVSPESTGYVEAHGTGTQLGDPIEVASLSKAFRKYTGRKQYCALGSHKPNIGHTITVSGVAGVIKILQAIRHRKIPPTINLNRLNSHIALDDSPFFVNTEAVPWNADSGATRRASISSFGFSGTNAHLVLEEYVNPAVAIGRDGGGDQLVVFSALTQERLGVHARNMARFLREKLAASSESGPAPAFGGGSLRDIAYTLQVGRRAMPERLALIVSSIPELLENLNRYLDGETVRDLYHGSTAAVSSRQPGIGDETAKVAPTHTGSKAELESLAEAWVSGADIDWLALYADPRPLRIPLPTYPFARRRFWKKIVDRVHATARYDEPAADSTVDPQTGFTTAIKKRLMPLDLDDRNADHRLLGGYIRETHSSFVTHRWQSEMTHDSLSYLTDHRIYDFASVPGGYYVEMAHAVMKELHPETTYAIDDLVYHHLMFVPSGQVRKVQMCVTEAGNGELPFCIHSRSQKDPHDAWKLHANGTIGI